MIHPAQEAGRRSASAFRQSLRAQLDQCCALAASIALDWTGEYPEQDSLPGSSSFHAPRHHSSGVRDNRPEGATPHGDSSAPAYQGEAASSNADSWMKFAQAPREQGGLGLTRAQAAGVVGNLQHESGHDIAPSGATGDRGTAYGAAQWRLERFDRLRAKAAEWGMDWRTTAAQQRFMRHELDTTEAKAYAHLRAAQTPEQAADAFNRHYERSADPGRGRRASARRLFEQGEVAAKPATPDHPQTDHRTAGELQAAPGRNPNLRNVDPRLREIMAAAATHLPPGYTMRVNEGYNPHGHAPGSQHHSRSGALDVQIFDPQGRPIANRGRDTTGMYTRLSRAAYGEMLARHPDLKGRLAWGGSFGTARGSGVPDLMHFDLGGERGTMAPHLSQMGPLPGERYGEVKEEQTARAE